MNSHQKYNHFASGYGAGRDAYGRTVYTGQGYTSPSDRAKMDSHMNRLHADVAADNEVMRGAQQNAMQQRAMAMQNEDRAFQKNMMAQNANRQYGLANKKLDLLKGLMG